MRISYKEMVSEFARVLEKKGFSKEKSLLGAELFAQNSLDGVYSHGLNRFPRVISFIEKGYINVNAEATKIGEFGSFEQWDGNLGLGNVNGQICMNRAIEIANTSGIGLVALRNNNHWMRGGTFGWQAANAGLIGICWTNTMPNMPAWGAKDCAIGNNPFVMAVPKSDGNHVVVDCAMSQFSYGKIEETRIKELELPIYGGYNSNGELTTKPEEIEETNRILPMGYWKGSSLSILLDLIAAILSGGKTVSNIGETSKDEYGLSQVFIALDPKKFQSIDNIDETINNTINSIHQSQPANENGKIYYPGERTINTRNNNLENGIPVVEEIWNKVCQM